MWFACGKKGVKGEEKLWRWVFRSEDVHAQYCKYIQKLK